MSPASGVGWTGPGLSGGQHSISSAVSSSTSASRRLIWRRDRLARGRKGCSTSGGQPSRQPEGRWPLGSSLRCRFPGLGPARMSCHPHKKSPSEGALGFRQSGLVKGKGLPIKPNPSMAELAALNVDALPGTVLVYGIRPYSCVLANLPQEFLVGVEASAHKVLSRRIDRGIWIWSGFLGLPCPKCWARCVARAAHETKPPTVAPPHFP